MTIKVRPLKRFTDAELIRFATDAPTVMTRWMDLLRARPALPDRWGFHIRKKHYYEPLPDFEHIRPEDTERRQPLGGIDFTLDRQVSMMRSLGQSYGDELKAVAMAGEAARSELENDWFSGLDAAVYYSLLRRLKPGKVIEIGGGYSTRLAARALAANRAEGRAGSLVCIEPYPQPRLLAGGIAAELIEKRVQEVPLSTFALLKAGDVLFVDSSHAARFGSDVTYLILEVLPTLAPGVWVHFHDIFFPTDYPSAWLIDRRLAFNEQYLLAAFLAFNSAFEPQINARWLLLDFGQEIRTMWPAEIPLEGSAAASSFWMKRTR